MAKAQDSRFDQLRFCRGRVENVRQHFGFIEHGDDRRCNIYFNKAAICIKPGPGLYVDLTKILTKGDPVECVYRHSDGDHDGKFSAIKVWKLADVQNERNEPSLNVDNVELKTKVLCGNGMVKWRCKHIGIIGLEVSSSEDDEDEDYNLADEGVYFNLKFLSHREESNDLLKCGNQVNFVAIRAVAPSPEDPTWNAISLCPEQPAVRLPQDYSAHLEVQKLSSFGALVSCNDNKIHLRWKELRCDPDQCYIIEVGDEVWCTVGKQRDDSIIWKVYDVNSTDDDRGSKMPAVLEKFDCLNIHCEQGSPGAAMPFMGPIQSAKSERRASISSGQHRVGQKKHTRSTSVSSAAGNSGPNSRAFGPKIATKCHCSCHLPPSQLMKGCIGEIEDVNDFGGTLRTLEHGLVSFDAHSFYVEDRPVCHRIYSPKLKVLFDAIRTADGIKPIKIWAQVKGPSLSSKHKHQRRANPSSRQSIG